MRRGRRCWNRSKANAATRATGPRSLPSSAPSDARRSSTTSRPCRTCRTSSIAARPGTRPSVPKLPGTKLVCVWGHVNKPGLYELPMGTPMKDIIYNFGGGILGGKTLKGVIPGGSSFPVLNKEEAERAIFDFDSMRTIGSAMGSGVVIVMDEDTCMIDMLLATAHFYHHESCGQCTQCREGTGWIEKIMTEMEAGAAQIKRSSCSTISPTTWSAIRSACLPTVSRCRSRVTSPSFATSSKRTWTQGDALQNDLGSASRLTGLTDRMPKLTIKDGKEVEVGANLNSDPGGRARRRHSTLLSSRPEHPRQLPDVPGRSRKSAEAANRRQHARSPKGWLSIPTATRPRLRRRRS